MNVLQAACEGCRKRIVAPDPETLKARLLRHIRNCAAIRTLAATSLEAGAALGAALATPREERIDVVAELSK